MLISAAIEAGEDVESGGEDEMEEGVNDDDSEEGVTGTILGLSCQSIAVS